jgi:hypothetical protein
MCIAIDWSSYTVTPVPAVWVELGLSHLVIYNTAHPVRCLRNPSNSSNTNGDMHTITSPVLPN